jgi:DNA invertase Pin-like site-specific DNA recombinase
MANHDLPAGRLQMPVLLTVAQFERSLIVGRDREKISNDPQ